MIIDNHPLIMRKMAPNPKMPKTFTVQDPERIKKSFWKTYIGAKAQQRKMRGLLDELEQDIAFLETKYGGVKKFRDTLNKMQKYRTAGSLFKRYVWASMIFRRELQIIQIFQNKWECHLMDKPAPKKRDRSPKNKKLL